MGPTVTSIANGTFYDCSALQEVIIPASVERIGDSAFNSCINLTVVELAGESARGEGESDLVIGGEAFQNCWKLPEIVFPARVKEIGASAFEGCAKLGYANLPEGMVSLGQSAFAGSGIETLRVPSTLMAIPRNAFSFCRNLKDVGIPEGLVDIGEEAFNGCPIEEIEIPSSVMCIGHYAFSQCDQLNTVVLANESVNIAFGAFDGTSGLNMQVPEGFNEDALVAEYGDQIMIVKRGDIEWSKIKLSPDTGEVIIRLSGEVGTDEVLAAV